MKSWEKPELQMIDVACTEHDWNGSSWDGGHVETIDGDPIDCPVVLIAANMLHLGIGLEDGGCNGGGSEGGTVDGPRTDRLS